MLTGNGAFCYTVAERFFVSFVIMLGGFVQARARADPVSGSWHSLHCSRVQLLVLQLPGMIAAPGNPPCRP